MHLDSKIFPLPNYWAPMKNSWDRVFLARRENAAEWSNRQEITMMKIFKFSFFVSSEQNGEIQALMRLPYMLPESWIIEVRCAM